MKLEAFDFKTQAVRVLMQDGQSWFVAADVCRVLEIANSRDAVSGLDEDERATVANADSRPGQPGAKSFQIISESGLYALVFKSRKPEAKVFRKWVTSEVLPAVRQTGRFEMPPPLAGMMPPVPVVSVLAFVRERCAGWALERQMEFGLKVRRYAKAMGVVFQTVDEPEVGRVFAFGRQLLEGVLGTVMQHPLLADVNVQELATLLEALHAEHGDAVLSAEVVRTKARQMGLFPTVWRHRNVPAQRSAFGWIVGKNSGRSLANGLSITCRRTNALRQYEVRREVARPA